MLDKHFTPPISVTLRTFGTRLGIIFSNLAIIFLVLTLSGIASFLFVLNKVIKTSIFYNLKI